MSALEAVVIETLCESQLLLRERVASLEADVDAYRLVAQQALHHLHDLTRTHDRLQAQYRSLIEQYWEVRGQLRKSVAA